MDLTQPGIKNPGVVVAIQLYTHVVRELDAAQLPVDRAVSIGKHWKFQTIFFLEMSHLLDGIAGADGDELQPPLEFWAAFNLYSFSVSDAALKPFCRFCINQITQDERCLQYMLGSRHVRHSSHKYTSCFMHMKLVSFSG